MLKHKLKMIILAATAIFITSAMASAQDVYVVYSRSGRTLKNEISKAMDRDLKVREYNADLLALADYSGKQKVVTKISRAGVVIIIGDQPMLALKGTRITSNVMVVDSVNTTVKSTEFLKYIVGRNTPLAKLTGDKLSAGKSADLENEKSVEDADIVIVDEQTLSIASAVGTIASQLAGS
jgi:hypothetical protein